MDVRKKRKNAKNFGTASIEMDEKLQKKIQMLIYFRFEKKKFHFGIFFHIFPTSYFQHAYSSNSMRLFQT